MVRQLLYWNYMHILYRYSSRVRLITSIPINPHFRILETSVLLWCQCGKRVGEWSSTIIRLISIHRCRLHRNHRDTRRPRPTPMSASGFHSKSLRIRESSVFVSYKFDANICASVLTTMILASREDE